MNAESDANLFDGNTWKLRSIYNFSLHDFDFGELNEQYFLILTQVLYFISYRCKLLNTP